jgi:hypothetical protein
VTTDILRAVESAVTAELTTMTASGQPITTPVTPYFDQGSGIVAISTGLAYPAKAERARREPRVSVLVADPLGPGQADLPVVLVQGLATVRDRDLQANTDRYVAASREKLPEATSGVPRAVLRRMAWYFARIWIEVTPLRAWAWTDRSLSEPLGSWSAPPGTRAPASDPRPPGAAPPPWIRPPRDAVALLERALSRLPLADLTVVGDDGFPVCLPARAVELGGAGLARVRLGRGARELIGAAASGRGGSSPASRPAALTVHGHPEVFTGQENHLFVGRARVLEDPSEGGVSVEVTVQRAVGDWSLAGGRAARSIRFLSKARVLASRVRAEAARRGQEVPVVRW